MVKQRNQKARAQAQQSVRVVMKKPRKAKKAILQSANPNQMVFDISSNSLSGHMQSLQGSAATGNGMTGMLGTTGNFYLDALVNPFPGPVRIPDEYSRPTAVHQTFGHFDVTTDDNGEACVILNPIWGDGATADPLSRWVSIIKPSSGGVIVSSFHDDPDFGTFITSGVVDGSRPTSSAVLCTFVGDTLSDGGQISACWVPGDIAAATLAGFYASGTGRSLLAIQPGAYSGALRHGSYCFWKPDDIEDYQLLNNTAMTAHSYPKLVLTFKSTQVQKVVARVACVTNFEFTTDKRVCETYSGLVEPDLVLHAKKILAHYPAACANDDPANGHVTLWQRIQQGCKDFFSMIGQSFRNLFAPSLEDINRNAAGINAAANLIGSVYNPMGTAAKAAAAI